MTSRRGMVGGAVLIAWLVGLALLVQREYFRPQLERLAEAATRVNPGAVYFGVLQGDSLVGFASSTIDTAETSIGITDYQVTGPSSGDTTRRLTTRTEVRLSRTFRLLSIDVTLRSSGRTVHLAGRVDGDTLITIRRERSPGRIDTVRAKLPGPVLWPSTVPVALALSDAPKLGKRYVFPVFDLTMQTARDAHFTVRAESLFVVNDSAVFDSTTKRWHGVQPDTVRAWRVSGDDAGTDFTGWIDEHGQPVALDQARLALRRMPYEVAFENWRADSVRTSPAAAVPPSRPARRP